MVIIHIYGVEPFFYYFMMTETPYIPSVKMEMRTSQVILTHKNIPKTLWDNYSHTLQNGRNIL